MLDTSSGFGGRLFGFFASNCKKYVGMDPSTKTFNGLMDLGKTLSTYSKKDFEIHKMCSEIVSDEFVDCFDLCFTSPPYFDTEKYSDEPTQSYIKFPTLKQWLNGFLFHTLKNCHLYTKRGGYTVINVSDKLGLYTVDYAKKAGFDLENVLHMHLSSISGKGRKTEPIFVFKKG